MSIKGLVDELKKQDKKNKEKDTIMDAKVINEESSIEIIVPKIDNNDDFLQEELEVINKTKKLEIPQTNKAYLGKYYKISNNRNRGIYEVGKLTEEKVTIDTTKPQIFVICGKIGSGKTYMMGTIIEEYLKTNPNMSLIVIDIMGIYFSLKYPNTDKDELLGWNDVSPYGFVNNIEVLIPEGDKKKYAKGTYDGTVSLKPNQLKPDGWLDLFQIKRTHPQGIVLTQVMEELIVKQGITDFSITDLISTLNILEMEAKDNKCGTFHTASATSIRGKFMAMQTWGIFSQDKGLSIRDITKKGKCIIIDISKSNKSIGALLCAFLSDKIYEERAKLSSEASQRRIGLTIKNKTEYIPPVTLILEEARNYIPNKTSTEKYNLQSLRTYIKHGRSPGLSLMLVTQEPGDLDSKALKQIKGLYIGSLTHKNDFDNLKRMSPFPIDRKWESLIRTLLPGQLVTANTDDKELRLMKCRPKHSIHVARTEAIIEESATQVDCIKIPQININDIKKLDQLNNFIIEIDKWKNKYNLINNEFIEYKSRGYEGTMDELLLENQRLKKDLSEKTNNLDIISSDLSKIVEHTPEVNSGILLATFDENHGYIPLYIKDIRGSEEKSPIIKSIVKSSLGMGETIGIFTFSVPNYKGKIYGKRFSIENPNARGNYNIYAIIIFSDIKDFNVDEEIFDSISNSLSINIEKYNLIDDLFDSLFSTNEINENIYIQELYSKLSEKEQIIEKIHKDFEDLKEKFEFVNKEKILLNTLNEKYKEQVDNVIVEGDTNGNDILKKIIEAKNTELENQTKTLIEYNNRIKKHKELSDLYEKRIAELELEITQIEINIPENTKTQSPKIEKMETLTPESIDIIPTKTEESIRPTNTLITKTEESITPINTVSIKNDDIIEPPNADQNDLSVIEKLQLEKKLDTFSEMFYVKRLEPIVNSIIKKINNLDKICFCILSILEAKAEDITIDYLTTIIGDVTVTTIRKHINKHLKKNKMIRIWKSGRTNRYSTNMSSYITNEIKQFIDINILSDEDLTTIYYKIRGALDLAITN